MTCGCVLCAPGRHHDGRCTDQCNQCTKKNEPVFSMEDVDATLKAAELQTCKKLLGQYVQRTAELQRRVDELEGKK